jgi:hypothetical protein
MVSSLPTSQYRILPCLTTTPAANWRSLLSEIALQELTEIALFLTCVTVDERRDLYDLLAGTAVHRIPHVHLRDDAEAWELDYLADRYGTYLFNLHPSPAGLALLEQLPHYADRLYLENVKALDEGFYEGVRRCGGLCLDFSHWVDFGLIQRLPQYDAFPQVLAEVPIGCCHVSAIVAEGWTDDRGKRHYNRHYFERLEELDYLFEQRAYLPPIVSLELENSIAEQLQAVAYLQRLLAQTPPLAEASS